MHQFAQAVSTGDLPALLATLADDITLWSDGGGKVAAALNPIYGLANVARFVVSVARKAPPGVVYRELWANSRPGIGMYLNGDPISVLLIDAAEERIQAIQVVVNPDKLRKDEAAVNFVRDFVNSGKPVAAICHGPWTLVEADVLQGKTLTSFPSIRTDLRNAGATWVDEQSFTCPANGWTLVTSRNPGDLDAFVDAAAEAFAD